MMELVDILSLETVKVYEENYSWEEALARSIQPLVDEGCVLPCYLNHILNETKTYGAYYILKPKVAVAHTRWQNGALEDRLALTLFKQPVSFAPHGEEVELLIAFCAKNDAHHLHYLKKIARLLKDDCFIQSLLNTTTSDELQDALCGNTRIMATV